MAKTTLPKFIREIFAKQGAKGGKTRAANMTAAQRNASAKKAAKARWAKVKKKRKK